MGARTWSQRTISSRTAGWQRALLSRVSKFIPALTVVVCLALPLVGCGPTSKLERVAVEGTVTLNGQPLAWGSIAFVPTGETRGPQSGGIIRDGKFSIPRSEGPPVGELIVRIFSPKFPAGTKPPETEVEFLQFALHAEESIHPQYNVNSKLRATTQAKGENSFSFELK